MRARMDVELLKSINMAMKWNVRRKSRTTMTRCPRKLVAHSFDLGKKMHESAAFERKKKRKLLHQSSSVHHEDVGQQCRSKSKTGLRKSKLLKNTKKEVKELDDFSGIELLAAVACGSFVHDNAGLVEEFAISKEHTTSPEIKSCSIDIKVAELNGLPIQQNLKDIEKEVGEKKVVVSKGLRLHWDLNTTMDEWEEPCDDLLIEPQLSVKHDAAIPSFVPVIENCNNRSVEETKKICNKTSDGESFASKSDVDLLTHPGKCEDFSSSTTSVLTEQTIVKFEVERTDNPLVRSYSKVVSDEAMQGFCDNKVTTDHVSECCGSNVTQEEQGHMAEGDSEDKLQAGYDSPFEDGELRERIDITKKNDVGTVEIHLSEKGQTMDNQTSSLVKETVSNNAIKKGVQVGTFERPHFDESRKRYYYERKDGHDDKLSPRGRNSLQTSSFDLSRNGEYVQRNRYSTSGDFSSRVLDSKGHRSLDSGYYNSRGGGYRIHDRRSSPSERNNGGYGSSYRGPPPPERSHSRDRYRYHSHEYHHDRKPCYQERKPRFLTNFNRHGTPSRSRSRSGSPIAWHFQKHKNLDTSNSGEIDDRRFRDGGHLSPERSYKCFDERRFVDGQSRGNRQSSVATKQRFDPVGYPERLKPDDYFRRPARFSQMSGFKYKDKH